MVDRITKAVEKFYHDLSISELKLQNSLTDKNGLTYNDILYLDIIMAHSGEYTATKIADLLCVSRPSVTKKINELVKKGFVQKQQSQTDKRVHYLWINESVYYDYCADTLGQKIATRLGEKYTEEQMALLCQVLGDIGALMAELDTGPIKTKGAQ